MIFGVQRWLLESLGNWLWEVFFFFFYGNSFINFQRFNYEVCLLKHSHLVQSPLGQGFFGWRVTRRQFFERRFTIKRDTSLGDSHGISKSSRVMQGNTLPPNCLNSSREHDHLCKEAISATTELRTLRD